MSLYRFSSRGLVRARPGIAAKSHPVARYVRPGRGAGRRIVMARSAPALRYDGGRIVKADPLR